MHTETHKHWVFADLKRRIEAADQAFPLGTHDLEILLGDEEARNTVYRGEVSDKRRVMLRGVGLDVFRHGTDWFADLIPNPMPAVFIVAELKRLEEAIAGEERSCTASGKKWFAGLYEKTLERVGLCFPRQVLIAGRIASILQNNDRRELVRALHEHVQSMRSASEPKERNPCADRPVTTPDSGPW